MKAEERNQRIILVAAQAAIEALAYAETKSIGSTVTKSDLFPSISRRSGALMQQSDDPIYEDEGIPPPDDKFLTRYWKDIKLIAASKYQKYIIPDTTGFRLGTLEEWCQLTPTKDMPIVRGIARSAARRSRIARSQGADSPIIDTDLKQLPSST